MEKKTMRNWIAALAVYLNYFLIVGVSVLVLSLNMDGLMKNMGTDSAGFGLVVSGIGIGKFAVMFISGALSDKFGRKPFLILGTVCYIISLLGIMNSTSVAMAMVFAVISGMANSFMDTGSYPALIELFPTAGGSASLLVKAFVSVGQMILPVMIAFGMGTALEWRFSFVVLSVLLALNIILLVFAKFPPMIKEEKEATVEETERSVNVEKPKMFPEGLCLILIGFTSTALFTIVQVWLAKAAQEQGFTDNAANLLLTNVATGSLVSVVVTTILVKKWIKAPLILFLYPCLSGLSLLAVFMMPSVAVFNVASFAIGFTTSGVLQLAIATMSELFPTGKGKIVGMINSLNSISIWVCPAITGFVARSSVMNVILIDAFIAAVGAFLGLVVLIRYRRITKTDKVTAKAV